MTEHDIPASVEELFELGECSYSIVGYDREMDNIESLAYFLDEIGFYQLKKLPKPQLIITVLPN